MSYYFGKLRSRVSQVIGHLSHILAFLPPLCHEMMSFAQVE